LLNKLLVNRKNWKDQRAWNVPVPKAAGFFRDSIATARRAVLLVFDQDYHDNRRRSYSVTRSDRYACVPKDLNGLWPHQLLPVSHSPFFPRARFGFVDSSSRIPRAPGARRGSHRSREPIANDLRATLNRGSLNARGAQRAHCNSRRRLIRVYDSVRNKGSRKKERDEEDAAHECLGPLRPPSWRTDNGPAESERSSACALPTSRARP